MLAYHVWTDEETKTIQNSGYSTFFSALGSHSLRDDWSRYLDYPKRLILKLLKLEMHAMS